MDTSCPDAVHHRRIHGAFARLDVEVRARGGVIHIRNRAQQRIGWALWNFVQHREQGTKDLLERGLDRVDLIAAQPDHADIEGLTFRVRIGRDVTIGAARDREIDFEMLRDGIERGENPEAGRSNHREPNRVAVSEAMDHNLAR